MKKHIKYTKIIPTIKSTLNDCIINNPRVIVYTITNNCVNISVPGSNENQSAPNILVQISSIELQNYMVRYVSQGVVSES